MTEFSSIFFVYLTAISLAAFLLFGIDKWKAQRERWRIPEKTLWAFTLAGGAAGAFCGMLLFRHKTRHAAFKFGVPIVLFLQIASTVFLSFR